MPVGSLKPDEIHLPGIFVNRVVLGENYEKRIEVSFWLVWVDRSASPSTMATGLRRPTARALPGGAVSALSSGPRENFR